MYLWLMEARAGNSFREVNGYFNVKSRHHSRELSSLGPRYHEQRELLVDNAVRMQTYEQQGTRFMSWQCRWFGPYGEGNKVVRD